jgi:uncharacterized RDD family membrane protein YckC
MPSPPPPGGQWLPPDQPQGPAQGQPPGAAPGQAYGTPVQPNGQAYGSYQAYPGSAVATGYRAKDPALAEWWERLLARVIDGIIVAILTSPIWIPLMVSLYRRLQRLSYQYPDLTQPGAQQAFNNAVSQMVAGMIGTIALVVFSSALVYFAYDWLQHGLWGQTIGKRALGTKVVTAQGHAPIAGGPAGVRAGVYCLIPAILGGIFWLIDVLWLTWDPRRQCLHDKAASSVVVKTRMLAPYSPAQ